MANQLVLNAIKLTLKACWGLNLDPEHESTAVILYGGKTEEHLASSPGAYGNAAGHNHAGQKP